MKSSVRRLSPLSLVVLLCAVLALTVGIVTASWILSRFMLKIQHATEKHITVKGVAERIVYSDLGSFECSVSVRAGSVDEGYAALNRASLTLRNKLGQLGFTPAELEQENITFTRLSRSEKVQENGRTVTKTLFDGYRFRYTVRVRTAQVKKIAAGHLKVYELTRQKLEVEVTSPQYFISDPEKYKLSLVDEASASAARRAEVVARKCGSTLGALLTARQGVIQITRPASNDTSDYGVYDTGSIEKVMRLVVTLDFALR